MDIYARKSDLSLTHLTNVKSMKTSLFSCVNGYIFFLLHSILIRFFDNENSRYGRIIDKNFEISKIYSHLSRNR